MQCKPSTTATDKYTEMHDLVRHILQRSDLASNFLPTSLTKKQLANFFGWTLNQVDVRRKNYWKLNTHYSKTAGEYRYYWKEIETWLTYAHKEVDVGLTSKSIPNGSHQSSSTSNPRGKASGRFRNLPRKPSTASKRDKHLKP